MTSEYSGRDNLDVMKDAKNYNRSLLGILLPLAFEADTIVDFGAGSGTFAIPLVEAGHKVVCVETDSSLAAQLAQQGVVVTNNLDGVRDESIDFIYSLNVLEHIENEEEVIALWHSKLRTGGSLVVYVPAFEILFSSMDKKVGHVRRYRKEGLVTMLRQAGFSVSQAKYADSLGFFASLLYRAFDGGGGSINRTMLKLYDRWAFPISSLLDKALHPLIGKNVYVVAIKV